MSRITNLQKKERLFVKEKIETGMIQNMAGKLLQADTFPKLEADEFWKDIPGIDS